MSYRKLFFFNIGNFNRQSSKFYMLITSYLRVCKWKIGLFGNVQTKIYWL